MSTNPNCAVVNRFIEEGINLGHLDSIAQFVWEDAVEQVPFPGQGPGLEGLKDVLRGMRSAFPDLHFSVEEQIAEGDKVLTRFEWTGTHRSDFLGVSATGRSVKVWGMVLDRLQDGRIKDTRIIVDIFGLMMQLDAFTSKSQFGIDRQLRIASGLRAACSQSAARNTKKASHSTEHLRLFRLWGCGLTRDFFKVFPRPPAHRSPEPAPLPPPEL
jgi:steroid delta-isomerase-like uncharacterized protein